MQDNDYNNQRNNSNSIISSIDDSESIAESNSSSILSQSKISGFSIGEDWVKPPDVDIGINGSGICPIFGIPIIQNNVVNGLQKNCKIKYNRLLEFHEINDRCKNNDIPPNTNSEDDILVALEY